MEKLWYYGKKYGTMEETMVLFKKTMVLWKKLWNFDLLWKKFMVLWKKLWYYSKL